MSPALQILLIIIGGLKPLPYLIGLLFKVTFNLIEVTLHNTSKTVNRDHPYMRVRLECFQDTLCC